jgi:hypothetical protein
VQIRDAIGVLEGRNGPRKQLPRLVLEVQQVVGAYLFQYLSQRWSVWPENKELLPEALGLVAIIRVVLVRARISGYSSG